MSNTNLLMIIGCAAFGYFFMNRVLSGKSDEQDSARNQGEQAYRYQRETEQTEDAYEQQAPPASSDTTLSARQCFDILGVPAGARAEEIRVAYRRKMAQYHPDKVVGMSATIRENAEQEAKRINQAYDYLQQRGLA